MLNRCSKVIPIARHRMSICLAPHLYSGDVKYINAKFPLFQLDAAAQSMQIHTATCLVALSPATDKLMHRISLAYALHGQRRHP
jgi:hypothetical protein